MTGFCRLVLMREQFAGIGDSSRARPCGFGDSGTYIGREIAYETWCEVNRVGGREMELKAVFWDMDGTLIDSEPYWHAGEMQIAHENGGVWNDELALMARAAQCRMWRARSPNMGARCRWRRSAGA